MVNLRSAHDCLAQERETRRLPPGTHRPKGGNKSSGCCDAPELQLTGLILSADAVSAGMPATVLKTHAKCFDVTARCAWRVKTLSAFRNKDVAPGNRWLSNRYCGALGAIDKACRTMQG